MGFVESMRNGALLLKSDTARASFNLALAIFTYGPFPTWPKWPYPPIVEMTADSQNLDAEAQSRRGNAEKTFKSALCADLSVSASLRRRFFPISSALLQIQTPPTILSSNFAAGATADKTNS